MVADLNSNKDNIENSAQPSREKQLFEVCIFFILLIAVSLALSLLVIRQEGLRFVPVAISIILHNLALVSLILFFIWRNGEPISLIGLTLKNIRENIAMGIWLFIPFFFGIVLFQRILQAVGLSTPSTLPSFLFPEGIGELALAFILIVVVAFSEETIFRGYLILRLKNITTSLNAAVILSTVIFSLGHGYEGSAGVIITGLIGLVFALVYIWRQSLVAPIVMHFLQNLIGIFLPVLLTMD